MKKLKIYGKNPKFEGFVAVLYIQNGNLVIETEVPKVKRDIESQIEYYMKEFEGIPQLGKGHARIEVTEDGKLNVEATDVEVEEGIRKDIEIFKKDSQGPYFVRWWDEEKETPFAIYIQYRRPRKTPDNPKFLDALKNLEWFWCEPGKQLLDRGAPKKYGGFEVDWKKSVLIDEE